LQALATVDQPVLIPATIATAAEIRERAVASRPMLPTPETARMLLPRLLIQRKTE
jgi:hypothetical protein